MDTPSREEMEKQIRFHEGQSEWNRWKMREERLGELAEMFGHWADREEVLATCPTIPAVLEGVSAAHAAAAKKVESLAEFAPKPKGRKKA